MSKISIIIPTINEASNLPLLLSDLSSIQKEGEIIIVDCGSEDKTIDIANIYGAKVFISKERNRGLQLDIGAKNSKGEWLIFLHADTRLTNDWYKKINFFMPNSLVHLLQLFIPKPDIATEISISLFSWRNFATEIVCFVITL